MPRRCALAGERSARDKGSGREPDLARCRSRSPHTGTVLVEGSQRGDGQRALVAQRSVEEAVPRDVLLGDSEQLKCPWHRDPGGGDGLCVAGGWADDTQLRPKPAIELHARDQMSGVPLGTIVISSPHG